MNQDARTGRTRDRILAAAEDCFAQNGFHATTVDELIAATGMSSSTVYRYFPGGKSELVEAVCSTRLGVLIAHVDRLLVAEPRPSVHDAFLAVMTAVGAVEDKAGESGQSEFTRMSRIAVNAWAERPRLPGNTSVADDFETLRAAVTQLARRWTRDGDEEQGLDLATLLLHQALGTLAEQAVTGMADVERSARITQEAARTLVHTL